GACVVRAGGRAWIGRSAASPGAAGAGRARAIAEAQSAPPRESGAGMSDAVVLERDDFSSNRHPALAFLRGMIFFRKPVPPFRDYGIEKLFGAGIDDRPELRAVPHLLHVGGEPAVAADPVLHGIRIIGHQIGGAGVARDLDAEGRRLVVIGHVESEARPRR